MSRALPGLPLITFVDASADEKKLLLFAGSDVDPGHYYLYDKATRHLDEVSPARPQLVGTKLAVVKPVSYPAADGTMIPGYLTLPPGSDGKNLPTIVMPHGGPGARDEWGFDWLAQFLANRGYAVLQPNFRGSTGYGDAWFKDNGFKSWRTAIGDVNDGGRWLIKQGIATPDRIAIFGWSYGGYAALQSAVLDPSLFKAIVAVAPVTDLETLRGESNDFTNHIIVDAFIGRGAHVREGSPAQNASRIAAPVLMFHGDRDQNVGIGESRLMASRLKSEGKQVELVEFHHLDHYLDDGEVRAQMLDKVDGFLRSSMKLPPAQ
ncbi:MAG: S9 family peptidase [Sphingomonas sp.]